MIRQNHFGKARSLRNRFVLFAHQVAVRPFDRQQFQHFQVGMHERALELHPVGLSDAEDEQAFGRSDLNRVVDDPDPVVRELFAALQLVQPDSQNPILNGRVRWSVEGPTALPSDDELENRLGCRVNWLPPA